MPSRMQEPGAGPDPDGQEPGDRGDLSARARGVLRAVADLAARGVGDDDGAGRPGDGRAGSTPWPGWAPTCWWRPCWWWRCACSAGSPGTAASASCCGIVGFLAGSTVLLHLAFAGADRAALPGRAGSWASGWARSPPASWARVGAGAGGLGRAADLARWCSPASAWPRPAAWSGWIARQSVRALVDHRPRRGPAGGGDVPRERVRPRAARRRREPVRGAADAGDDRRSLEAADDDRRSRKTRSTMSPEELAQLRSYERTLRGCRSIAQLRQAGASPAPRSCRPCPPWRATPCVVGKAGEATIELDSGRPQHLRARRRPAAATTTSTPSFTPTCPPGQPPRRRAPGRSPPAPPAGGGADRRGGGGRVRGRWPRPTSASRAAPRPAGRGPRASRRLRPVIVTPVDQPEVRAIVEAQAAGRTAAPPRAAGRPRRPSRRRPGFIRLSEGDFVLPPVGPAGVRAAARPGDRQAGRSTTWPPASSRRCPTTASRATSAPSTWARSSRCTSSRPRPAPAPARSPSSRTTWPWRSRRRRCASSRRSRARRWSASRCRTRTAQMVYLKEILADESLQRRQRRSCRSRSARTSRATRSASTWPRCRTCWSPAPPARASRSRSTG